MVNTELSVPIHSWEKHTIICFTDLQRSVWGNFIVQNLYFTKVEFSP